MKWIYSVTEKKIIKKENIQCIILYLKKLFDKRNEKIEEERTTKKPEKKTFCHKRGNRENAREYPSS